MTFSPTSSPIFSDVCRSRAARFVMAASLTCIAVLMSASAAVARPALETGVTVGVWSEAHPAVGRLGARLARVEFPIGTRVASMRPIVASLARQNTRLLPLAGFHGRLPSGSQARSLRSWAREFGPGGRFWRGRRDDHLAIRDVEFGNETSYSHQYGGDAQSYAARARAYGRLAIVALDALDATGVGLMVQGDDGGIGPAWATNMLSAAPALGTRVSAWTVHPYGDRWDERLDRLIRFTREAGAPDHVPVAVTEWGLATAGGRCLSDNYGWGRCLTFGRAARIGRDVFAGIRRKLGARLRTFILYSTHDLDFGRRTARRESHFGLTTARLSDKGAYTRFARDLLAGRLGA